MRKLLLIIASSVLLVGCKSNNGVNTDGVISNDVRNVIDEGTSAAAKDVHKDFTDSLGKLDMSGLDSSEAESSEVEESVSDISAGTAESVAESSKANPIMLNGGEVTELPDYIAETEGRVLDKLEGDLDVPFTEEMIMTAAPGFLDNVENGYVNVVNAVNNYLITFEIEVSKYDVVRDSAVASFCIMCKNEADEVLLTVIVDKHVYEGKEFINIVYK